MQFRAWIALLCAFALSAGCFGFLEDENDPREILGIENGMQPWEDGQSLFYRQSDWLGGDGAHSRDLGDGHVLWLFGDSLVRTERAGEGERTWFVHNTVAIQKGYNVAEASIRFYWGEKSSDQEPNLLEQLLGAEPLGPEPHSLIPDPRQGHFFWPHDTLLIEGRLIIFASEIRSTGDGPFAFQGVRWTAFEVNGPLLDPSKWSFNELRTQGRQHETFLGIATVVHDGHVYAYGHRDVDDDIFGTLHDILVARWSVEDVLQGNLARPEWWGGHDEGWGHDMEPEPLFTGGIVEGSVHFDVEHRTFVMVRLGWFGAADVVAQTAPAPEGPWSDPVVVYAPPEAQSQDALLYAGKTHPWHARETGITIVTYHDHDQPTPRMARSVQ